MLRKKSPVTRPGIDPESFRLVAQRLNHYAIPGPTNAYYCCNFIIFLHVLNSLMCHIPRWQYIAEKCRRGWNYEVCAYIGFANNTQIYLKSSHVMPVRNNTNFQMKRKSLITDILRMGSYNATLHSACPWTENVSHVERVFVIGGKMRDLSNLLGPV